MFKDFSPVSKLIFSLLVVVFSTSLIFILGALLAIPLFDVNYFTNPEVISPGGAGNINLAKYFQLINSIGLFVLPSFIISFLFMEGTFSGLKLNKRVDWIGFALAGLVLVAALPMVEGFALFNAKLTLPESLSSIEIWMKDKEELATNITIEFLKMENWLDLLTNMIMIAFVAAIGEELLFRGVFQRFLSEWFKNVHIAIFVTAFFFSAFHMQFYGFLPRMFMGVILGYLFVWSNNIWLPIFGHFVNNGMAIMVYYFMDINPEDFNGNPEFPFTYTSFFISMLLVIVICYYFRQRFLKESIASTYK